MARKSVEANIAFDDTSKLYYVHLDYGRDETGKRIKKYKTFEKLSDAHKALKEFTIDRAKGVAIIPKSTSIKEWLEYYLLDIVIPNREKTTVYGYLNMTQNHIIPALGEIPVQKLTPQQVQKYYTMLMNKKNLSANSVKKHHDFLKTALKLAVQQDIILRNPLERVEPPRCKKKDIEFYSKGNLIKLLQLVKDNRLEIIVYLGILLGLRREEICGLQWNSIDFDKRVISIHEAKTMAGSVISNKDPKNKSSHRTLFISDDLFEALMREMSRQNKNSDMLGDLYIQNNLVVKWENGKEYRPNYISELFTKFIKDNGLPHITLHGLRHSFISLGNSQGVTLFNLSKVAGHSTPDTTGRIYTHLEDETHEDLLTNVSMSLFRKNEVR
jgi:integrase